MTHIKHCVLVAVLAVGLPVVLHAQAGDQTAPSAPSSQTPPAPTPATTQDTQLQGRETYEPDTTPLSASQLFGLGFSSESLNVLNIGFSAHEHADSNVFASGTGTNFRSVTSFFGDVNLNRIWKRNALALRYTGGGSIYSSSSSLNNTTHSVGLTQSLAWQRWTLRFGDQFTYSPYSPYGIGLGGLGYDYLYGLGNLVLHPGEVPDQSIFSTRSSRLGNTVFSNLDYSFTRRTALTFSGNYGILRFNDASFYDSKQYGGGVGLSHQLNGHDSISVNYLFRRNTFDVLGTEFETHTAELRYGRRITGRLALELWGGPEINYYDNGLGTVRHTYGSGGLNLRYQTRAMEYWASYNRGVRSGSGILVGSVADTVTGGLGRDFGRRWSLTANGGYSRNTGIVANTEFNSGFGGIFLRRALGRNAGIGFNYGLQRQTSNCRTGNCAVYTRQLIGVSFDWHMNPIRLGD